MNKKIKMRQLKKKLKGKKGMIESKILCKKKIRKIIINK